MSAQVDTQGGRTILVRRGKPRGDPKCPFLNLVRRCKVIANVGRFKRSFRCHFCGQAISKDWGSSSDGVTQLELNPRIVLIKPDEKRLCCQFCADRLEQGKIPLAPSEKLRKVSPKLFSRLDDRCNADVQGTLEDKFQQFACV